MSVKKYLSIVTITTVIMMCCAIFVLGYNFMYNDSFGSAANMPDGTVDADIEGLEPVDRSKPYNILVLGVDVEARLTDVMILCQVDPVDHKVNMLSIPRDTRVKVKGTTMKINSTYSLGGVEQVVETVKNLTGLPVNHYFLINTKAFRDTIDALGGVYYTVPRNMDYEDPLQDLYIHLSAGYQRLDGSKAEQLVRFRQYPNGDVDRIKVQQDFLKEIIAQKLKAEYIVKIPSVYEVIESNSSTDMTPAEMLSTGKQLLAVSGDNFKSMTVPGEGQYVGSVSYYLHDQAALEDLVETEFK